MPNQKYITGIVVLLLIVLGFAFYWYSYRPEQIRKTCYKRSLKVIDRTDHKRTANEIDWVGLANINREGYKSCLQRNGLED